MQKFTWMSALFFVLFATAQSYEDAPYLQDCAIKYELGASLAERSLLSVRADRNGLVQVLSSNGLLRPHEKELMPNLFYRPVTDMKVVSMKVYSDQFYYLTDKEVFSNSAGGKDVFDHQMPSVRLFDIGSDFSVLIVAADRIGLFKDRKPVWESNLSGVSPKALKFDKGAQRFLLLAEDGIYEVPLAAPKIAKLYAGTGLTSMDFDGDILVVGTNKGILRLSGTSLKSDGLDDKLPSPDIKVVRNISGSLWFGTAKGAFKLRGDGKYDYYASKRWLVDDEVIDIAPGPELSVLVLTSKGLSQINFREMTLAEKADYFQKIQRQRHIRYGFTADLTLKEPGNLASGYYKDTDNDGLWTSMYLASELFRYAVTKSEDAKQNAYEAFEAMERLTDITPMHGFPARSYERDGYEMGLHANGFSEEWYKKHVEENGRIWRLTEDEKWRWKSTTSSDESCGHFFVYALFAELAPDKEWKERAVHQIKIQMDHIMDNNWYLVDWNGEPTAWGRWNPKYVNSFPINVGDRRLNSTLILSFLQTAYHFTQDEKYKKAANKLIKRHGYDENANRPATVIGYVEGQKLSDGWNHSDDEMYFLTAPGFVNYSFSEDQRSKHLEAVKSHWQIERSEKNPLWNYLYALCGGTQIDVEDSAWWLREFPIDLIDWKVDNSHRNDLVKIEPNFRGQTYTEVLPPDERPLHNHNGAYRNNGGSGGKKEYAPYLYLLPYWAGRYVEAITPPVTHVKKSIE